MPITEAGRCYMSVKDPLHKEQVSPELNAVENLEVNKMELIPSQ